MTIKSSNLIEYLYRIQLGVVCAHMLCFCRPARPHIWQNRLGEESNMGEHYPIENSRPILTCHHQGTNCNQWFRTRKGKYSYILSLLKKCFFADEEKWRIAGSYACLKAIRCWHDYSYKAINLQTIVKISEHDTTI